MHITTLHLISLANSRLWLVLPNALMHLRKLQTLGHPVLTRDRDSLFKWGLENTSILKVFNSKA